MIVQLTKEYNGQQAGAKLDLPEEEANKLIKDASAKAVEGDPLESVIDAQIAKRMDLLDKKIEDGLKKFALAAAKSCKNSVPIIFGEGGDGDVKKSFGSLLIRAGQKAFSNIEKDYPGVKINAGGNGVVLFKSTPNRLGVRKKTAMAEASGVAGGYTVPPDFYDELIELIAEQSIVRQHAFVYPMASATAQFPFLDVTTAQAAGISPFFGGLKMSWTAEAQTRTETEPQFKMMELKANELSGYSVSSNILLQDAAFGLETFLMQLFSHAVAWFEDYAFLQGNGVGKPQGMMNAAAAIGIDRATANKVGFADVATMWANLLPASNMSAIWCCSPSVIPQLLQLQDGANRAIFISIDQGATKRPQWSLLGAPVYITEKLPALGTTGDLILIDPDLYVIGDRQEIEIAASEHVNFLQNQMTWRVVERVDGQPWMEKPITLQDGSTQVSPFVTLDVHT